MKKIDIDEALYQYIASNTRYIGESASSILRRLLALPEESTTVNNQVIVKKVEQINDAVVETEVAEEVIEDEPATEEVKVAKPVNSQSVFNVINREELAAQRGAVGRFLLILAALHRVHQESFSTVCQIRGRDRLYFATSESALAESGSSTKPRQIPDSPYWVITNSNTTRKKMMLTEVASAMGYSKEDIEGIRDLL